MIYLASPYSHENDAIREERYEAVAQLCANLFLREREPIFSPIIYGHRWASEFNLKSDHIAWLRFNTAMLRTCHTLWVMKLDGWQESKGVQAEIKLAQTLLMPIHYIDEFGDFIL